MHKVIRKLAILVPLLTGCNATTGQQSSPTPVAGGEQAAAGNVLSARFPGPAGFQRAPAAASTFAHYLRRLPLKPVGAQVHLYDGSLKPSQAAHAAVIDMSVGERDLQQCADAVMRLRAEYLFAADRKQEISFNFTSGFKAPFSRWANGERIKVQGNSCSWVPGGKAGSAHADLLDYLEKVFTYAGTASLSNELKDCSSSPVQAGDVFIQGGHPGHAVIVVDVAENRTGEQVFLLAQSYMPAQEIHVLKNLRAPSLSPWFKLNDGEVLETPEWTFRWDQRKRWR